MGELRVVAVVVPIVLAIIFALTLNCSEVAEASSYQFQNSDTLSPNYYMAIAFFYAQEEAQITYDIQSYDDSRVDVLILDMANFNAYTKGLSFTYLDSSSLNIEFIGYTTELGAFTPGNEYVILIDNSDYPDWGGVPNGRTARFTYSINLYNVDLPAENNDSTFDIFTAITFVGMFGVFAVFFLLSFVFRKTRIGRPYSKAPKKRCPTCGSSIPAMNTICPKCGNKC